MPVGWGRGLGVEVPLSQAIPRSVIFGSYGGGGGGGGGGRAVVLPGILGGRVPPGSSNPDPISEQKLSFFTNSIF